MDHGTNKDQTDDAMCAAEALLSSRGLMSSDLDLRPDCEEILMLDSYILEFDITNAVARLPRCFGKDYGMHIEEFVMLCDPKNNEVEVQVEIINRKVFFKNGWFGLRDFYNIDIGAWATLIYEHPRRMRLSLKNRYDEEVDYPDCSPPIIAKLDRGICCGGKLRFFAACTVELSAADIASGFLVLPWVGFCQKSLPSEGTEITVVDYLGFAWKCFFQIVEEHSGLVCKIGGAWGAICKARRLAENDPLKLAVTEESANKVVYLRYLPIRCRHKDIVNSSDRVVCFDAAMVGFLSRGSAIRITDEFSIQEIYKLKSYVVELDPTIGKARMPSCFAKECGLHIDEYVMLRDPNMNMFEVRVHKKKGKVYLRDGWAELKDVYKVGNRAWVTLTYIESNLMHMIIKDKSGFEIEYPNNSLPPITKRLIPAEGCRVLQFYRTSVHILTSSDINSGYLVLPWFGFCEDALPRAATRLSIIDHFGNIWRCEMVFIKVRNNVFCRIGGQWSLLCAARNFMKGHAIKLAVTRDTRNGVLHIRHVPLQCVHSGFTRSMKTTNSRDVYQVNHYFVQCPLKTDCGWRLG